MENLYAYYFLLTEEIATAKEPKNHADISVKQWIMKSFSLRPLGIVLGISQMPDGAGLVSHQIPWI